MVTKYSKKLYNSTKEADQLVSCISNKQFLESVYNQYLNAGGKRHNATRQESLIRTTAVGTALLMAMHKDKNVCFNGPIYKICCEFIKQRNKEIESESAKNEDNVSDAFEPTTDGNSDEHSEESK